MGLQIKLVDKRLLHGAIWKYYRRHGTICSGSTAIDMILKIVVLKLTEIKFL